MTILIARVHLYRFSSNIVQRFRVRYSHSWFASKEEEFSRPTLLQRRAAARWYSDEEGARKWEARREFATSWKQHGEWVKKGRPWGARSGYVGPRERGEREPGRLVISSGGVISWMQLPSRRAQPPLATRAEGRRKGRRWRRDARGERATGWLSRRWWEGGGRGWGGTTFEGARYLPTPGEMAIECI